MRLPPPQPEEAWDGCVVIHEHGERIVLCDQLKQPILDLRPKSDYLISFRGEVPEDYRRLLEGEFPGLRQRFNLFPYGIGAARLVEPDEAIQADRDYWVLSKEPLPHIGEPSWIRHSIAWHGWHVTLISLPSFRTMSNGERAHVERIFQRSLLSARLSAVIVSPLPHHFSDSGIAVYPDDVDELQIALGEPLEVQLSCDGQRRGTIRYEAQEGICTAEFDPCGRWTLTLSGQRLLEWIKSEVEFFEPAGISLRAGGEEVPLLSQQAQSWLEAAGNTVFIRSPNAEVAECLSIDNTPSAPATLEIELPATADRVHSIDAGNFGRLTYGRPTHAGEEPYDLGDVRAKVTWLKSMALHERFSGPYRLQGNPEPRAPGWIAELTRVGWASSLIAQVRDIQNQLVRVGVWRV